MIAKFIAFGVVSVLLLWVFGHEGGGAIGAIAVIWLVWEMSRCGFRIVRRMGKG
jgi:hypothetical protein